MKRCLSCKVLYLATENKCSNCGFKPEHIDGFDSYAPEFASESSGFKSNYFAELAQLEEFNFWFISRNKLILWALEKYSPDLKSFLEIGCGTGYVLTGISKKFPNITLHGSEIFIKDYPQHFFFRWMLGIFLLKKNLM
jgi:tRNA G46 methylase TrmB